MRRLLLAILALGPCACATARPSLASRPWVEVTTPHFRIFSDADPEQASRSAVELERYRRAMLLLWSPDVDPPDASYAAVLRSRAEVNQVAGTDVVGYYGRFGLTPPMRALVVPAEIAGGDPHQILLHEVAHLVTELLVPHPPTWVAEGLATYLETARITAPGEVQLGVPNRTHAFLIADYGLIDLDRLWAWKPATPRDMALHYAAAWALVHHLLDEHPREFSAFLRALASGGDARAAWDTAFASAPLSSLWKEVRAHAASGRWPALTSPFPPVTVTPALRPLSEGEAHAALAWLNLVSRNRKLAERIAGYRKEVTQAVALDPAGPLVTQVSAWREELDEVEKE